MKLFFEVLGALLQVVNDSKMLWACTFALTALNTIRSFSLADGCNIVFAYLTESFILVLPVGDSKNLRNGNAHWASFYTVVTGGTGDGCALVECILCATDDRLFLVGERHKVPHETEVFLHLRKA